MPKRDPVLSTARPRHRLCRGVAAAVATTALMTASAAATWAPSGAVPAPAATGRIWSVAISPAQPSLILAGSDGGVVRSTDGGVTWTTTSMTGSRVWTVGFDARDGKTAYAGLDGGGIARSSTGGATWLDDSLGLSNQTVRTLAFGLDGIAAGTANGVALSADGTHWRPGGLDGYSVSSIAVAANAPQFTLVAGVDGGDLSKGYLFRNIGGSLAWEVLQGGLPTSAFVSCVAGGPLAQGGGKRPLVVNTNKGTYHSIDGGTTWTLSSGIPDQPSAVTLTVSAFSPLDPSLVYAGADAAGSSGGALLRSIDGGATFADAASGLPDRRREITGIAVAPTAPPALVVAADPAAGTSVIYREVDATVGPPPPTVAEGAGPAIPATIPTPAPLPKASPTPTARAAPTTRPTGSDRLGSILHWPMPLAAEIALLLLVGYIAISWRQRYLDVEGPP